MTESDDEAPSGHDRFLRFELPRSIRSQPSLKDMAVDFIREEIVAGRLGPGSKVDQDGLAEVLGISRLPIREALIELAARGFVNAIPRRGSYVVKLTVEDIEDHFEVLGMLFALVARRAAAQISDGRLATLRNLRDRIAATTDPVVHDTLNVEFYASINQVGSSDRLLLTLKFLALALPNDYYSSSAAWAETEATYRDRMLAALEAHDAAAAAATAEEHLRTCARVVEKELRSRGYWSADADQRRAEPAAAT